MIEIRPQEGYQQKALSSEADIVIGGGSAGAGKTWALLIECLRNVHVPKFNAVVFRKTYPQIKNAGGLWDTSRDLFPSAGGVPYDGKVAWFFPHKTAIYFKHLQRESDIYSHQGAEYNLICFDELTHFSEKQFFYLLSRNRSTSGVRPYVRCTTNPDPDSWVARFIDWWIGEDGYPIPERDGVVRYFARDNGEFIWGSTPEEVKDKAPYLFEKGIEPKSATYVFGDVYGNKKLLEVNPEYLGNLMAQDEQTKLQLLKGNWKIKTDGSQLINMDCMRDAFTNTFVKAGRPYLSCDIALQGSDKLVIVEWLGLVVVDIQIVDKSNGKEVVTIIKEKAKRKGIGMSSIVFDGDGVGGYLGGYLEGAVSFNNGGVPRKIKGKAQNFTNLKTQCYFKLADMINNNEIYISDSKHKEVIIRQARVIIRDKIDHDGKLTIIPKQKMKNALGESPDILDALMMRMYYELVASFDF